MIDFSTDPLSSEFTLLHALPKNIFLPYWFLSLYTTWIKVNIKHKQ